MLSYAITRSVLFNVLAIVAIAFGMFTLNMFKNFAFLSLGLIYAIGFTVIVSTYSAISSWMTKKIFWMSVLFLLAISILPLPPWIAASIYYADYKVFLSFSQNPFSIFSIKSGIFWIKFLLHFFIFFSINLILIMGQIFFFARMYSYFNHRPR